MLPVTALCACVQGGIPDPGCELCGGTAEVCTRCNGLGRVADHPCDCDAGIAGKLNTPPDPECARLAFAWSTALA